MNSQTVLEWLEPMAQQPSLVYAAVALLLIASSFGLPVPEELTLISAGLIAHVASREGQTLLNPYVLAAVCFFAVLASDFLVFSIGRKLGDGLREHRRFAKALRGERAEKIQKWTRDHGSWACAIFRFTPGLRFPGHLTCGAVGISPRRFVLIDGAAALLSVPTQVLLVAFYGDVLMEKLRSVKLTGLIVAAALLVVYLVARTLYRRRTFRG